MSTYRKKNENRRFNRQVARRNAVLSNRSAVQLAAQRNAIHRVAAATGQGE